MARLAFGGFETGHPISDGFTVAGSALTMDSSVKRSGGWSAKCPSQSGGSLYPLAFPIPTPTQGRTYHARCWFRLDGSPAATMTIMRLGNANNLVNNYGSVQIDTSRRILGGDGSAGPTLATNTWYCVELEWVASGTTVTRKVRLDGADVGSSGTVSTGVTPSWLGIGMIDAGIAASPNIWLDDWALNDDQGSANTSWCGPGGVVVALLPASDNAIGANWKLGDGSTPSANAYDSVNNVPPIGAADPSAAGAQIKDAVGSTTQPAAAVDFNMQSYTAAGIPSSATFVAAQPRTTLATDFPGLVYSALQSLSNPVIADKTIDTTGSGGSPGAYPTNWKGFAGNIVDSPTVTPGTQPVLRLRRNDTQSNTLWCSQIVLYVEYSAPPSQNISPAGIASAEALGSPVVTQPQTVAPGGIASEEAFGTPRKVVTQRSTADLPHLAWPFRLGVVVEQDSAEELQGSAAVIACTPRGWRPDAPSFGVTTPLFEPRPVDTVRLAGELARSDPRLSPTAAEAQALAETARATVRIDVTGGRRRA